MARTRKIESDDVRAPEAQQASAAITPAIGAWTDGPPLPPPIPLQGPGPSLSELLVRERR